MVLTPPISHPVLSRHADQAAGQTRGRRHARRIHRQDITRRLERSPRMVRRISEPRRGRCQHDRERSAPPPNDTPNLAADSQRTNVHEQTTHAARDKNSLPNVTGGRPFAATSAVPRRKSPEEVAAMRPAWDGSPKDTAAHPGGAFILIIVRAIRMTSCFGSFGYFWLFWLFLVILVNLVIVRMGNSSDVVFF